MITSFLESADSFFLYPSTPRLGFSDLPSETGVPSLSGSGLLCPASESILIVSGCSGASSLGVELVDEVALDALDALFFFEDVLFAGFAAGVGDSEVSSEVWLDVEVLLGVEV